METATAATPESEMMSQGRTVSLIGRNRHSTFWNSRCRKAPTRPAAPCWIITTGTICSGAKPMISSTGVTAVPKPMPAEASMNSKNSASTTTPQKTRHSVVPTQPSATVTRESSRRNVSPPASRPAGR